MVKRLPENDKGNLLFIIQMRSLIRSRIGRQIFRVTLYFLLGILILLIPGLQLQLTAVPPQATVQQNTATQQGIPNRQELESFMDEFFTEQMEELHVPGATIALVKDGEVFFTKGYGYADIDKQTPVTPDQTVFRVGLPIILSYLELAMLFTKGTNIAKEY
ncbi:serine hydrolase [Chroococcidiopsis sp. TS-821]|uniref:serine hydrolase n=1 Tax=Chroococcidiopsis sp. TS-821 TaxID=1378066 RepID=UPI000CEECA0F|nr:serine hydrolase domain-containing protein [Chroococcidiopsis sp. TS-821]PPS42261.1 hypothetical protein B1A85_14605 [Chroococcidiopsis sp. TS-821]